VRDSLVILLNVECVMTEMPLICSLAERCVTHWWLTWPISFVIYLLLAFKYFFSDGFF
jgi:hypothetical protein